jgi:ATP-binding cassette subfamily C (CFTR/MRP) protein 1
MGAVLVGATALVAVLTPRRISPALVGLALSYAVSMTGLLNSLVRQATETETYLACVERVQAYAELRVEAPPIVAEARPPPGWPHAGAISIRNLTARYRPGLPPVLSGVSVEIPAGCRVGVCGRTGSGKSSLMLCLFRILEAEAQVEPASAAALQTETRTTDASGVPPATGDSCSGALARAGKGNGAIVIDGIDISTLGLDDLRSRLAIIPQDPVLFAATLRCVHCACGGSGGRSRLGPVPLREGFLCPAASRAVLPWHSLSCCVACSAPISLLLQRPVHASLV